MKINLLEDFSKETIEVTITYRQLDSEVLNIVEVLNSINKDILATEVQSGARVVILVNDIYYIETIDRKCFIYTKNKSFEVKEKFDEISDKFSNYGFCKINRTTLLNVKKLERMKQLANSRLEGLMG